MASLPKTTERRLVIAIDYGTEYTSVAFATPLGNRADLDEIHIIDDWCLQMGNHDAIPSVISYSHQGSLGQQQWGWDLSPEAIPMKNTKLELDIGDASEELDFVLKSLDGMCNLDFQHIERARGLPEYPWKGPEEIVGDYLTKVLDCLLQLEGSCFEEKLLAMLSVDIVVTIPEVCGHIAFYLRATEFRT
ncbi:MAG: hypothetical protein M1839_003500 [Geoglossum umbratile]|nr:MAG: hypothetical protein M1839_003500 [Geoglossum umbratile]